MSQQQDKEEVPSSAARSGGEADTARRGVEIGQQTNNGTVTNATPNRTRQRDAGPPSPARPCPSLTELCLKSLCDHDLTYCFSLEHVPDHLAADMMVRIMQKGRLSPLMAYKFQSSTCDEVANFASECIKNLHNAQIHAGPVTPKSYGCRY